MIRDIWFSIPLWLQAVSLGLVFVWLIQLILILCVRMRPLWQARRDRLGKVRTADALPSISVVVYAHNQAESLQDNLPRLMACDYPDFEVIVVDDGSSDETEDVLMQMDQRYSYFFHTTMADRVSTVSRRKLAMLLGVKAAHNDVVLMTQAQCVPKSSAWLRSIGRLFADGVDAVIGPVVFEDHLGLVNRFCQWDLFDRVLSSMGLTLAVKTFGGWSSNMAFRKEVFFANKNYAIQHHLDLQPGEDDLFLTDITRGKNVTVACSADAVVVNRQSHVGYVWKQERRRRAFTERYTFVLPRLVKHLDSLTRWLVVASSLVVAVAAGLMMLWWVMGAALLLLVLHALCYVLVPYNVAKMLDVHRHRISPLVCSLLTPLVNIYFRIKSRIISKQFYVGRI